MSPAGVVRSATSVEFAGYPGESGEALAKRILGREIGNLAALRATLDRGALGAALQRISAASGLAIVGFWAVVTLAQYAWYNVRKGDRHHEQRAVTRDGVL